MQKCFIALAASLTMSAGPQVLANAGAADTTNADDLALQYGLTGAGVTVGVWEASESSDWSVRASHVDFRTDPNDPNTSRVTIIDVKSNDNSPWSGHATHVAGTIAGSGYAHWLATGSWAARGMAPGALVRSYSSSNDYSEMARDAGVVDISNHSYGNGVTLYSDVTFSSSTYAQDYGTFKRWNGTYRDQDDELAYPGQYNSAARALDATLHDHPTLLSVWSAGNDGGVSGLSSGNYVARFSTDIGDNNGTRTQMHYADGSASQYWILPVNDPLYPAPKSDGLGGGGYDTLTYDRTSKNALVVGSIKVVTADPHTGEQPQLSGFSSRGPTDDGRLGVHVVGNGEGVYSAHEGSDSDYHSLNGTSMSAPNVTGTAALLLQHWRNRTGGHTPTSASQKGLLMHTATDVTRSSTEHVGPGYRTGYGLVNGLAAAELIDEATTISPPARTQHWWEGSLADGAELTLSFTAGAEAIKASLAWIDPEGPTNSFSSVDDRDHRALVNDLDLWIEVPNLLGGDPTIYYPWTLDPDDPSAAPLRNQRNDVDNFEQVLLDPGWLAPGSIFTLHIGRDEPLLAGLSQSYSLFLTGATLVPEPSSAVLVLAALALLSGRRRRRSSDHHGPSPC